MINVSFGPKHVVFGSWQWVACDLTSDLKGRCVTSSFLAVAPHVDVVVFVKFLPERRILEEICMRSRIVFCPINVYGVGSQIDGDSERLNLCHRIATEVTGGN